VRGQKVARIAAVTIGIAGLAACVPQPKVAPPRSVAATPPPPPAPVSDDWTDWPATPGNWTYARDGSGTVARFGSVAGSPRVWLRCDLAARTITLGRGDRAATPDGSAMLTVRTSNGVLQWPGKAVQGALAGTAAVRMPNDVGLDWIAFSRGRFTVEIPGMPAVVAPTWAEPQRVIEDCRG
jgi:hypothetical protein